MAACLTERGAAFCRWTVAGKLHNQEKLLRYFAKSREGNRREELEAKLLEGMNREGDVVADADFWERRRQALKSRSELPQ